MTMAISHSKNGSVTDPNTITVTIPGRLAGLNEHDEKNRTSAQTGARFKKEQQTLVGWAILAAGRKKAPSSWYPLSVTFKWYEKNRMRDPDNIAFAKKYILDALQEMGTIKGDGWRHIKGLADEFYIDAKNPRIEVTLRKAGGL